MLPFPPVRDNFHGLAAPLGNIPRLAPGGPAPSPQPTATLPFLAVALLNFVFLFEVDPGRSPPRAPQAVPCRPSETDSHLTSSIPPQTRDVRYSSQDKCEILGKPTSYCFYSLFLSVLLFLLLFRSDTRIYTRISLRSNNEVRFSKDPLSAFTAARVVHDNENHVGQS